MQRPHFVSNRQGFTLLEISIVLILIGLLAGALLVGKQLISAAGLRAQVNQVRQFQIATVNFRNKYGYLPGDIPSTLASRIGLATRGATAGKGDGNGIIEGVDNLNANSGDHYLMGEASAFWTDLATVGMIEGKYSGSPTVANQVVSTLFPPGKQSGTYVYIWSGQTYSDTMTTNHFAINRLDGGMSASGVMTTYSVTGALGFTPFEAWDMDTKFDDGAPLNGKLTAIYSGAAGAINRTNGTYASTPVADGTNICVNDGNSLSNAWAYSVTQPDNNCGISIKFE